MTEEVNSTMMYLIYCKNFCKCHNVSPAQQLKKKKKKGDGPRQKESLREKFGPHTTTKSQPWLKAMFITRRDTFFLLQM
jgi:hypothetical protein